MPVVLLYGIDGILTIGEIDSNGKILVQVLQGKTLINFCINLFSSI